MESVLLTTSVNLLDEASTNTCCAAVKVDQLYLAAGSAFASLFSNIVLDVVSAMDLFRNSQLWAVVPRVKQLDQSFEFRKIFCVDIYDYDVIKTMLDHDLQDMEFRNTMDRTSKINSDYFRMFALFSEDSQHVDIRKALHKIYDRILPLNRQMIGNVITVLSTPFQTISLYNSYSQGIISNVFGRDQCLFLIDVKLSLGCEGSPVFSTANELLGMVMYVFTWFKGEWMGFSLAVHLYPVIKSWLNSSSPQIYSYIPDKYSFIGDNNVDLYGVVVVRTPYKWGSGVIINKEKGIIMTCSHVVDFSAETTDVIVEYKEKRFNGKILYATSRSFPFDLAVIEADDFNFENIIEFKTPLKEIEKGEAVYVIAYPLFSFKQHLIRGPSVTYGHVSNVYPNIMVLTTCASNSGSSGGALVRPNGELLGIVANNVVVSTTNLLIPHITVVIPSTIFLKPIARYCLTGDKNDLKNLTVKRKDICDIWQLKSSRKYVISKL